MQNEYFEEDHLAINITNRRGLETLPWGTQESTSQYFDVEVPI